MSLVIEQWVASSDECAEVLSHKLIRPDGKRTQTDVRSLGPLGDELRQRCWSRVMRAYGRAHENLWPDLSLVVAMPPGDSMIAHADNVRREGGAWVPNHTPHRLYTSLLYLSSADGGELHFPALGLTIEPRPGRFVSFPCGREWEHQVLPVKSGWRYALSMWYTDAEQYREG